MLKCGSLIFRTALHSQAFRTKGKKAVLVSFCRLDTNLDMHEKRNSDFFFSIQGFSDCHGAQSVSQAGPELRNSTATASVVLGLKVCATTPCWKRYS